MLEEGRYGSILEISSWRNRSGNWYAIRILGMEETTSGILTSKLSTIPGLGGAPLLHRRSIDDRTCRRRAGDFSWALGLCCHSQVVNMRSSQSVSVRTRIITLSNETDVLLWIPS